MKKQLLSALFLIIICTVTAQANKDDILQDLEKNHNSDQDVVTTATLKSASRLFEAKDDLTTVISVIPSGSTVTVIDSDSTYFHVIYENNEGYIFMKDAVLSKSTKPAYSSQKDSSQQVEQEEPSVQAQQTGRLAYLEKKYGKDMAARLYAGKIWKGMNSGMVKDSWGSADKINRVINGNTIKEEWIYRGTWLYFENNTLLEWGAVKK